MNHLSTVFSLEMFKVKKSIVIRIVASLFSIAPLMAGFFTFILQDPEFAQNAGLIGEKAQILGEANAISFFEIHGQMISVGGIIVYGFVTSWIFGREYADKTIIDLLTLPYSRSVIVMGKFFAAFVTNFILTLYIIIVGIVIGFIIQVEGLTIAFIIEQLPFLLIVSGITIVLSTPVAFFASVGKGYLSPLGFVIIILIFSQIISVVGFGHYFPWSIPALYSGIAGDVLEFNLINILIIIFTSLVGIMSTLWWYLYVDQG